MVYVDLFLRLVSNGSRKQFARTYSYTQRGNAMDEKKFTELKTAVTHAVTSFVHHCPHSNTENRTGAVLMCEKTPTICFDAQVGFGEIDYRTCFVGARSIIFLLLTWCNYPVLTSYQLRNPSLEHWGGGVLVKPYGCFSLYGISELPSEACLLYGLHEICLITEKELEEALTISSTHELFEHISTGVTKN